jgi:hypothetical protein
LGGTVPRELEQGRVQVGVRVRCAEEVTEFEQFTLARETCLQTRGAPIVDPLGGLADGKALEYGAGLKNLDRFVVRDLAHARAAMRLADDETFLLETDEGGSDGTARHLECGTDLRFDEAGVRAEVAVDDGCPERVVVGVCLHGGPAYCRNIAKIVNNSVSTWDSVRRHQERDE